MPNVIDNEELYNVVVLGGVKSPGKVTLSGHDRVVNWDVKSGPSIDGGRTTLTAIPPIQFTASFYLVKDPAQGIDDMSAWPAFLRIINSTTSGPKPVAKDIYHPDLAENDIRSVVKASVGGATYDGKGGRTVVVKFQEYRVPRDKGGTPAGAQTGGTDPNADVKARNAALRNQYQATPWG